jgi:hypothetical protein
MSITPARLTKAHNTAVDQSISNTVKWLALGGISPFLKDDEVFIRTHLGRIEIQNPSSTVPRRLRTMLLLVDGRRTLADFRRSMTRYRNLDESLDMLFKMGLIERLPELMEW